MDRLVELMDRVKLIELIKLVKLAEMNISVELVKLI